MSVPEPPSTVNLDSSVYYTGRYWNDWALTRAYLNRLATGDPERSWMQQLRDFRGAPFEHALILNCGNGWVERDLVEAKVIRRGHGIDISPDLISDAWARALGAELPLTYEIVDTNHFSLSAGSFDLIVNHAAAHHIAWIDHTFREICRALPADGVFASMDYVGPHRNQYPYEQWQEVHRLNRELPRPLRQELVYPHLPSMIGGDPTEAVHSELILEVLRRYFIIEHCALLGGALAYPVLTFNEKLFDAPEAVADRWVRHALERDEAYTSAHPSSSLFAWVIARPDHSVLERTDNLDGWSAEEAERETRAAGNSGRYYERTLLQELTEELEHVKTMHHLLVHHPWRRRLRRVPGHVWIAKKVRPWLKGSA